MNISVEVTGNLLKYLDSKVHSGFFKSRSEVVRQAIREMIQQDLAGQLEAKGITMDEIESIREEVSKELVERKYGKRSKNKSDN
jgi:putative addiction module CopG family antidote